MLRDAVTRERIARPLALMFGVVALGLWWVDGRPRPYILVLASTLCVVIGYWPRTLPPKARRRPGGRV